MTLNLIWAQDMVGVIGVDGAIPWHHPADLRRFRRLTMGSPVIMGRRTWESLPGPLDGRLNVVVGHQPGPETISTTYVPTPSEALRTAVATCPDRDAWVIGGTRLFDAYQGIADRVHRTIIPGGHATSDNLALAPAGWVSSLGGAAGWERTLVEHADGATFETWEKA